MKKLTRYMLSNFGGNAATKGEIIEACKLFDANPDSTTNFMIQFKCDVMKPSDQG